jgi:hypothetical protein
MKDGCGGRNLRELTLNCQFDSAEHTTKSRCRPRSARSPFDPGTEGMRQQQTLAQQCAERLSQHRKALEYHARPRVNRAAGHIAGSV